MENAHLQTGRGRTLLALRWLGAAICKISADWPECSRRQVCPVEVASQRQVIVIFINNRSRRSSQHSISSGDNDEQSRTASNRAYCKQDATLCKTSFHTITTEYLVEVHSVTFISFLRCAYLMNGVRPPLRCFTS